MILKKKKWNIEDIIYIFYAIQVFVELLWV